MTEDVAKKKIKLLIVDDSAFMRIAIKKIVERGGEIEVVGEAADGKAAIALTEEKKPDVITMDVEMPVMGGLEATKIIMDRFPRPVIMVSNFTQAGSLATFEALERGAVDFVSKSSSFVNLDLAQIEKELLEKITYWAKRPLPERKKAERESAETKLLNVSIGSPVDLIVIASSTGGPSMICDMLEAMGKVACPAVVAQHMPEGFTKGFADHISRKTGLDAHEGEQSMAVEPGRVIIAPGGHNCTLLRSAEGVFILQTNVKLPSPYKPSADLLFMSAAAVAKNPAAAILTGMGDDGTKGAKAFRAKGFAVLAQTPETCVVDGMPKSAIEAGLVTDTLSLRSMGKRLAMLASQAPKLAAYRKNETNFNHP